MGGRALQPSKGFPHETFPSFPVDCPGDTFPEMVLEGLVQKGLRTGGRQFSFASHEQPVSQSRLHLAIITMGPVRSPYDGGFR